MGLFQRPPPNLPIPAAAVDSGYVNQLLNVLRLYFTEMNAVQHVSVAALSVNTDTLPTQADWATLREGEVYVTSPEDNVLKIKYGALVGLSTMAVNDNLTEQQFMLMGA